MGVGDSRDVMIASLMRGPQEGVTVRRDALFPT